MRPFLKSLLLVEPMRLCAVKRGVKLDPGTSHLLCDPNDGGQQSTADAKSTLPFADDELVDMSQIPCLPQIVLDSERTEPGHVLILHSAEISLQIGRESSTVDAE